jgi:hypothetical protein
MMAGVHYLDETIILTEERARELSEKIPGYNTWPEQLVRIIYPHPGFQVTIVREYMYTGSSERMIKDIYGGP